MKYRKVAETDDEFDEPVAPRELTAAEIDEEFDQPATPRKLGGFKPEAHAVAVAEPTTDPSWRTARVASMVYRTGTENWSWEAKIRLENGTTVKAVIKLVKSFYDAEAHRRIPRKWPFG